MLLSTLVSNVKRRTQVSDPSNLSDQPTIDIINFLNNRMYEVWRMWPWNFLWVPINFNTVPGQSIYSIIGQSDSQGVLSSIGDIIALTNGTGGYLVPVTYKRYLQWLVETQINPQTQQPVNRPPPPHSISQVTENRGSYRLRLIIFPHKDSQSLTSQMRCTTFLNSG